MVSSDRGELEKCSGLVVPGVGAFAACMAGLVAIDAPELIRDWVSSGRPLLGICVGHQILFGSGCEHGLSCDGVGLYPGEVTQLPATRLPHMGWNTVAAPVGSVLFEGVAQERFYFVHSYAAMEPVPDALTTLASHEDIAFVAAVERGSLASTQFHPEKSGAAGARVIANWLATVAPTQFG